MNKRHDLSAGEKLGVLKKYDELPQMSQRQAARLLNVSQSLLSRILKTRQEIENASLANKGSDRKRKRAGKEEEVEMALKQWYTKVREKDAQITGPLLRQKAQDLAKKLGKNDFVATEGWFHRWKKRENISFAKPHREQSGADQNPMLDQKFCTLHAHQIAKKITLLDGLANEAWNVVSKTAIRNCFRPSAFILSPKKVEAPVVIPTDLSGKLYDEWLNIKKEDQSTQDICDEIQSKRQKECVAADSNEDEPDKKQPSTKDILEALLILRRGVQQRGDSEVFKQHQVYEQMIEQMIKNEKSN